jgi:hypothetical protein
VCLSKILSVSLLLLSSSAFCWGQEVSDTTPGTSGQVSTSSIDQILKLLDNSDQAMTQLEASSQEWWSLKAQLIAQLQDSDKSIKVLETSLKLYDLENKLLAVGAVTATLIAIGEMVYIFTNKQSK